MPNPQRELCIEILRRLHAGRVLPQIVLVGSWCMLFYREYFSADDWLPAVRTRDMDLLVPEPRRLQASLDLVEELRGLGFVPGFRGEQGYMMLQHPELILEFLVPERGRGHDGPYDISALGVNAQALRFMDMLAARIVRIPCEGMEVPVPHPAYYAVHKLVVAERRGGEKRERDLGQAVALLELLHRHRAKEEPEVRGALTCLSARWRSRVIRVLEEAGQPEAAGFLTQCLPG